MLGVLYVCVSAPLPTTNFDGVAGPKHLAREMIHQMTALLGGAFVPGACASSSPAEPADATLPLMRSPDATDPILCGIAKFRPHRGDSVEAAPSKEMFQTIRRFIA